MLKVSAFLIFSLFLSSCSLYKSEERKAFESKASETLDLQSLKQMKCDDITELEYWYETRFPAAQSEWLQSQSENLEVWQRKNASGHILIQSYERVHPYITRCEIAFSTLSEWRQFKDFYFKSLEGDPL